MADEPSEQAERAARRDEVVLGVDYGTKRVGLALGYADSGLAVPIPGLQHAGDPAALAPRLLEVARARDATRVVLGHPVHMSGDASPMSRAVERLREALLAAGELEVELQDERLSSATAEAQLAAAGLRWWQYEKGTIDAVAALGIVREHLHRRYPELALTAEPPPPDEQDPPGERPARADKRDRRRRAQRAQRKQRRDREEREE